LTLAFASPPDSFSISAAIQAAGTPDLWLATRMAGHQALSAC
jgi:hypothetical protein